MESNTRLTRSIQQQTSQCVKCGLCLPHCPTYAITQNECESPRGRIALIDAIAKEQIPLSEKTQLYLDHCLTCRACEAVCPAQVNYGEIIDKGRELIMAREKSKSALSKTLDFFIKHPSLWRLSAYLIKYYQRCGLGSLLRKSKLLKALDVQRAEALLPKQIHTFTQQSFYRATTTKRGQLVLFTGCINQLVDQITIQSAIKILTACGYDIYIPNNQQCCGALHQHAGLAKQAHVFANKNLKLFAQFAVDKIITITTGCSAHLQEYTKQLVTADAKDFADKIIDINQFLSTVIWPDTLTFKALPNKRAVIHTPCTLRNVLKQPQAPAQIVQYISALEIISLTNFTYCCGAAGEYMLAHPTMAETLLEKTLQAIIPLKPDYLITSNIGCSLHLQKGLKEKHFNTRVLHPVVLLAEQLNHA